MLNFTRLGTLPAFALFALSLPLHAQPSEPVLERVPDTALVEIFTVEEFFEGADRIPLEIVGWQDAPDEAMQFAIAELRIDTNEQHVIELRRMNDTNTVAATLPLAAGRSGVQTTGMSTAVGDFMINNFSEICGKWHHGIRGVWRFCTGNDCRKTNDPIFQPLICIQRKS